jgi:formate hydrogenlyase subunit 3/multisubunit Na+/H+ antiporter MnhD subunit
MPSALLLATPLLPLALALAMIVPALRPVMPRLLPLAALPALATAAFVPVGAGVAEPWLLFGAGASLDPLSRVFLGFTALLWLAAAVAARHWLSGAKDATGFTIAFLLAMAGNLGLILAADVASFYAFFAMMSFASYGLVIHTRTPEALFAGWRYMGFVLAGELALFAGLALAVDAAGSLLLADLRATALAPTTAALILLGFGVKLGIMPLHFWLPPAHGAAPVPASAVLSGAMIKAGLFGMMAVLPLGVAALPEHGIVLLAAGLVTIFAATLLGGREANPKAVLGFSSVGQMGMAALGIGAALLEPAAWVVIAPVLVLLAAHHALAKAALFLGAGALLGAADRRARIILALFLAAPALVLAGAPGTSGAMVKEALKAALSEGPADWAPWLGLALTLSTLATTLLMARFAVMLWQASPAAGAAKPAFFAPLPFFALAGCAVLLPALWPALAPDFVPALPAAGTEADGAVILLAGLVLAATIGIVAHARAVGPVRLARRVGAPLLAVTRDGAARVLRVRRGLRVLARRVPAALATRAEAWRIGQVATVGVLAAALAIEASTHLPVPFP